MGELDGLIVESPPRHQDPHHTALTPTLASASLDDAPARTLLTPTLAAATLEDDDDAPVKIEANPMPLTTVTIVRKKKSSLKPVWAGGAVQLVTPMSARPIAPVPRPPPKRVQDGDTTRADDDEAEPMEVQDEKRIKVVSGYDMSTHAYSGKKGPRGMMRPKFAKGSSHESQFGASNYGEGASSAGGGRAALKKGVGHFDASAPGALVLHEPDPERSDEKVHVGVVPFLAVKLRPHQASGVEFIYNSRALLCDRRIPRTLSLPCCCPPLLPRPKLMRPSLGSSVLGRSNDLSTRERGGCILADDMGLGKTLQTVAMIYTLLYQGPAGKPHTSNAAVICPTTLCGNWKAESVAALDAPHVLCSARVRACSAF